MLRKTSRRSSIMASSNVRQRVAPQQKGAIMSRPTNRQERFLISCKKGKRRAERLFCTSPSRTNEQTMLFWTRILRNTTKRCSCDMCGNPRRVAWSKGDRLTMQEKRQENWKEDL